MPSNELFIAVFEKALLLAADRRGAGLYGSLTSKTLRGVISMY